MQTFAEDRFQREILAAPDRILVATDLTNGDDLLAQVIAQAACSRRPEPQPSAKSSSALLLGDCKGAAGLAMDLAQAYHAELTLVHVLEPDAAGSIDPERIFAWAHNALISPAPSGEDLVPPICTRVGCGNLIEEIVMVASEIKAAWIVLGVDAAFPFWPSRDSTAYMTIAAATCRVLALRHEHSRAELEIGKEKDLAAVVERCAAEALVCLPDSDVPWSVY